MFLKKKFESYYVDRGIKAHRGEVNSGEFLSFTFSVLHLSSQTILR